MKDKILEVSISGLQKEGLRFSVDTIAKKLKISKKTIYKIFPSKEELAVAVYEKFYEEIIEKLFQADTAEHGNKFLRLLNLYYQSFCMVREDVFNKFALNETIRNLALKKHTEIRQSFKSLLPHDGTDTTVFIIDGVFEKLNGESLSPLIAEKLERLI